MRTDIRCNTKNTDDLPERKLMRAVFVQAIVDAVKPPRLTPLPLEPVRRRRPRTKNNRRIREHEDALAWVLSDRKIEAWRGFDGLRRPWPFNSQWVADLWQYPVRQWRQQIREGKVGIGNIACPRD